MIETLISVVIYLVIAGLIWWAVTAILALVPLPDPIRQIVNIIMIVILCLICIYSLLPLLHFAGPRLR